MVVKVMMAKMGHNSQTRESLKRMCDQVTGQTVSVDSGLCIGHIVGAEIVSQSLVADIDIDMDFEELRADTTFSTLGLPPVNAGDSLVGIWKG